MKLEKLEKMYTNTYKIADYDIDVVETLFGEETIRMFMYDNGIGVADFTILCSRGNYELYKVNWIDENVSDAFYCELAHDIVWNWNNKYDEMVELVN